MDETVLGKIGSTPIARIGFETPAQVFAKLEYLNPSGSIKDRTALFMVEKAEADGLLAPGGTIVEASSGNQGISLAMIGAIKGYKVVITSPKKVSAEKLETMRAYGAKVVLCEPTKFIEDPKSYHSRALLLHKKIRGSFMPNQYFNLDNPQAHYETLGPEIWEQTNGKITHFFAAAGTGGTVSGAGKFLKEKNPDVKVIAVDTATSFYSTNGHPKPYKLEGIGLDFKTPCFDEGVVDEVIPVKDKEATDMMKTMARAHGLLIGPSSGAVAFAAQKCCAKLKDGNVAVIVLADSGRAYLSKKYF